jgi:hypothetical protein
VGKIAKARFDGYVADFAMVPTRVAKQGGGLLQTLLQQMMAKGSAGFLKQHMHIARRYAEPGGDCRSGKVRVAAAQLDLA